MTKADFVAVLADRTGTNKRLAAQFVDAMTEAVSEELAKGGDVRLVGFGTFEVGDRAARTGKNPQTGEEIEIPACRVPKFKPGKALKDAVNG